MVRENKVKMHTLGQYRSRGGHFLFGVGKYFSGIIE